MQWKTFPSSIKTIFQIQMKYSYLLTCNFSLHQIMHSQFQYSSLRSVQFNKDISYGHYCYFCKHNMSKPYSQLPTASYLKHYLLIIIVNKEQFQLDKVIRVLTNAKKDIVQCHHIILLLTIELDRTRLLNNL